MARYSRFGRRVVRSAATRAAYAAGARAGAARSRGGYRRRGRRY